MTTAKRPSGRARTAANIRAAKASDRAQTAADVDKSSTTGDGSIPLGDVGVAVAAVVAGLRAKRPLDDESEVMAAVAASLAAALDGGIGMAIAATAKQLALTLEELTTRANSPDDPIAAIVRRHNERAGSTGRVSARWVQEEAERRQTEGGE